MFAGLGQRIEASSRIMGNLCGLPGKRRTVGNDPTLLVGEQLSIDADAVKMESKIIEDLGADSLDVVELIMALEEKFEVEIPDSDAEKLIKIEDVVNYIDNLKK